MKKFFKTKKDKKIEELEWKLEFLRNHESTYIDAGKIIRIESRYECNEARPEADDPDYVLGYLLIDDIFHQLKEKNLLEVKRYHDPVNQMVKFRVILKVVR